MLRDDPQSADRTLRRIAGAWASIGFVGLISLAAFAVAVFGFRVTVHDRYTGAIVPPGDVAKLLALMLPVFGIFAALGGYLYFKLERDGP